MGGGSLSSLGRQKVLRQAPKNSGRIDNPSSHPHRLPLLALISLDPSVGTQVRIPKLIRYWDGCAGCGQLIQLLLLLDILKPNQLKGTSNRFRTEATVN